MCLLSVYLPGAHPDRVALERAARRNPDGFGWAIIVGDEIVTHRTLDPADGVASFCEYRAAFPDGHALWHARLTTHGTTSVDNCHPFTVGNDARVVAAHNGVLPLDPTDGRSDTRVFAEDMASVHYLDDATVMEFLAGWVGRSKLAFLSVHPASRSALYIVNEHLGEWDRAAGVWYSNDSHREPIAHAWRSTSTYGTGWASSSTYDEPLSATLARSGVVHVPMDPDSNPWDEYRAGDPVVECDACGEWWPAVVEWCDGCGNFLDESDLVPADLVEWQSDAADWSGGES